MKSNNKRPSGAGGGRGKKSGEAGKYDKKPRSSGKDDRKDRPTGEKRTYGKPGFSRPDSFGDRKQDAKPEGFERTYSKPESSRSERSEKKEHFRPQRAGRAYSKPEYKSRAGSDRAADPRPPRSYNDRDEHPKKRSFSSEGRDDDKGPRKRVTRDDRERFEIDKTFKKKTGGKFGDREKTKSDFTEGNDRPKTSSFRKRSDDERPESNDGDRKSFDRPKREYTPRGEKPTFSKRSDGERSDSSFGDRKSFDRPKREYTPRGEKPAYGKRTDDDRPKRAYTKRDDSAPSSFRSRPSDDKATEGVRPRRTDGDRKPYERKPYERKTGSSAGRDDRPARSVDGEKKWNRKEGHEFYGDRKKKSFSKSSESSVDDGSIRLNKFIANAGICSRREADDMIAAGVISVNGQVITEMGYKVQPTDNVKYNNAVLKGERTQYILLNKPKDFITTTDDPDDRKTVMGLISKACKERVYPVGRLDRNTTGVLLFTNDGDLAKKLTHPSFGVQKIYQVELDKNLKQSDFEAITEGLQLEDGPIKVDDIVFGTEKNILGVELHSGKNRIVRRIFEHLSYEVKKLDRVVFAGLTKKDLPRGRWRFLTDLEIANLKMAVSKVKVKAKAKAD